MSAVALPMPRLRFHRLIWLMPAAFAPHIVEEYGTGFPDWVTHTLGGAMTGGAFLMNNAVFMAILVGLTAWAALRPSPLSAFVLLSWASGNLFWNFVFHLATTVLYDRFSPGLITAVLLYFPISLAVGWAALSERVLSRVAFAGAVSIGGGLMLFVIWAGLFQPGH
ncbi:MAG TPA: HXXEE domain-containing protein [Azospirillum sp.]|nr:HXXEE domain-containing protein [Azospirillum sp.]